MVLGASMGGLLAARALADFYEMVTVVERDVLPDDPVNRRGVPQGRHVHALLGRGSQVLAELFPGFLDDLVAAGVPVLDYTDLSTSGERIGWRGGCCSANLLRDRVQCMKYMYRELARGGVVKRGVLPQCLLDEF